MKAAAQSPIGAAAKKHGGIRIERMPLFLLIFIE